VRFDALFTFLYSKRPGTPAAEMPDDTPKAEKQRRFDELLALQNSISEENHRAYVGRTLRALIAPGAEGDKYPLSARTNGGRLIPTLGERNTVGTFQNVKITGSNTWALIGEIVK
jgi:tRNA-2-methylthio-N6-dimethylallyladenosine synthase